MAGGNDNGYNNKNNIRKQQQFQQRAERTRNSHVGVFKTEGESATRNSASHN